MSKQKNKRITKKMASELCKKVVGTDKGIYKCLDTCLDCWILKIGVLVVSVAYENSYDTFSKRVDGNRIEVTVCVNCAETSYIYFDPDTLEAN